MLSERELWYWIGRTSGFTWRKYAQITEKYAGNREIFAHIGEDRRFFCAILGEEAYAAACFTEETEIRREIEALEEQKIRFLTPADELFPPTVSVLAYDRPFVLYYAGDPELFRSRGISIVGTRRCSNYGAKMSERFASALAKRGLTVVSGLADGIDSAAHNGALSVGGNTIAVLGSGLKHITPSTNTALARRIVRAGGLVCTEFPPDFAGARYSYPQRNRLIAALGEGVVLIEAGEKSGALYTVDHAVEQGKNVFLLPSNADNKNFAGVARVYRAGKGEFVFEPNDVAAAFGLSPEVEPVRDTLKLDVLSQKVLDILSDGALDYDRLFETTGLMPSQFSALLTNLEIMGLIGSQGGLYYKK